ncbi:hypothetical protein AP460_02960 [Actinobacillus pleuropneumoniae]|nr:hypothetical protein AP460_02960 [Actinobacillus pleuropneumoniae]KIE94266.1 protease III [Actinobacillus pleuropneumoniae]
MRKNMISRAISYALSATFALGIALPTFANNPQNQTASGEQKMLPIKVTGFDVLAQTINKSPNDKAIYQAIRLQNGMTVLLISDEKANKSLMSLAIPIGSMEDPQQQQGLAHYLEHMILMGSKQFPETNSLDQS